MWRKGPGRAAFRAVYDETRARATITVLGHAGHGMQKVDGTAECFGCPVQGWIPAPQWLETIEAWLRQFSSL